MTTARSADKAPSSSTEDTLNPATHVPPVLRNSTLRSAQGEAESEPEEKKEGEDADGESGDVADGSGGRRSRPRPHHAQAAAPAVGIADANEGRRALRPGSRSRL